MLNMESVEKIAPVMSAYGRFPVTIVKGKGCYVWDDAGKKYLDFTSGIAVCALGHVPDAVEEVLKKQLDTLWHCSNLFHIASQEKLAGMLTKLTCCDQVFFCNSGAEANEGAIKLARRYAHLIKGKDNGHIVTFNHSFHGRTMATLTATAQEKIQNGFGPLMPGFRYLPYNSDEAIQALKEDDDCIAVMLEMVQGEGGVIPADPSWIKALADVCKEKGMLLMVDEVQTGIGRTGTLFAYQQYGIEPDVVTAAKALGSGIPIGAFMAKKHVSQVMTPGTHGSTFGGNPFATTAGVATLEAFEKQHVLEHCEKSAAYLNGKLIELKAKYPGLIKDVRGKGLLIGVETTFPAIDAVNQLREEQNVLILTAGKNVLRILPPLVVTNSEIDHFIKALGEVLNKQ
ncbi:aspartate aminotransferase family protein [Sporolactobacillus shoreae]|uniref:Acetylornithine aminotransferase n=1 Tax=Sporolactobacillus shoreae TaxID=1465501 RepID=A0A4Z0GNQ6_9BACL|nr:aspartate aminotransferase family protein [Sporolactobacillus shoreae]TGA97826.1 aspartate aminotransferase family protein [Sporolactobacillus shoreae]